MQQFTKIILFLVLYFPLMLTAQPQAITAADVLRGTQQLNIDADRLLQQRKLAFTAPQLPQYPGITPAFNFQLHIAIIEILHEYELDLGLRPIPIVTASPIAYTPADVMYLNDLVRAEMRKILEHHHLKASPATIALDTKAQPADVFQQGLLFYLKLITLDDDPVVTPNHTFSQVHRIQQELQDIVTYQASLANDAHTKRSLISSIFGSDPYSGKSLATITQPQTAADNYKLAATLLQLISGRKPLALPAKPTQLDVFIQSQIIIAELGAWKLSKHIASSTPITAEAHDKSATDVQNELAASIYLVERLQAAKLW